MGGIDAPVGEGPGKREPHRKRRPIWKRRRFWIVLISIVLAILVVLWLISSLGVQKEPD